MTQLLNVVYGVALVFLAPWLAFRAILTGRYRQGLSEKLFGIDCLPGDDGKPVAWFHGVSVGEIHLLGVVVAAFRRRHPDWRCVVSATTETGLAEARKRFPDLTIIPWPFDFSWAVHRTLNALAPKLVILAESELWPNFLRIANARQIPVVVINGRMSPTSAGRYRKLGWLLRPLLLARVARFGMQSDGYANALRDLGVVSDRVQVTGSVKYDGALSDRHNPRVEKLRRTLGLDANDRFFVAGSTHAPEEQIVLDLFRRLRVAHSELRLILAPRSADRFEEVARLIEKNAFPFARRSQITGELPGKPPVILLDTIGELNAAWGLADVGFTGGSLDGRRGGQSMIEPAGLGVPVVFGPHVWNFRDAAARLLEADAAIKIDGPISMKQELQALLDDDARRARMGDAARRMVIAQQGATEKTIDLIDDVLRLTSKESLRVAA